MVDHATTATDWNIKPMKKFSTAVLLLTFGVAATCLPSMAASQCEFHAHAPDTHLIQTGDTLWDLAGTFLKDHGCWPRVWEHNRQQIRNPHRIYPGQTIYFDKLRGSLRLDSPPATSSQPADLRLSPTTRSAPLATAPIAAIAPHLLRFLSQAPLLSDTQLGYAPRVAAFEKGRTMASRFDTVFVEGSLDTHSVFTAVRPADAITDPDTGMTLGYTAMRVGVVQLVEMASGTGNLHRFLVSTSSAELRQDDRLIPLLNPAGNVLPPPHGAVKIAGRIVRTLNGGRYAGQYDLVAINRGRDHGLDTGSVLSVMKHVKIDTDDTRILSSPVVSVGTLLVFDVAQYVSFALVMQTRDGLAVGDLVNSPGTATGQGEAR